MSNKVRTVIKRDYISFFEGNVEDIIKNLQELKNSQPEGVSVEVAFKYSRFSDEEEPVFYAVRDMTEEEIEKEGSQKESLKNKQIFGK